MLVAQNENLLPKGLADRVALKTREPKHQLLRFRGLRKLPSTLRQSRLSRVFLGILAVLYFAGYQPALAIPPVRQSTAEAAFAEQQTIQAEGFPEPFILPHPGYLSTRFSSWHPGIDIATGYSMPIHPIAGGKIVDVTYGFFGLGHSVTVEHIQGFRSIYGHMGKIFVRVGDSVTADSILGQVGMTGRTTGPHTHLEVTKNGEYLDPLTILPALSDWPEGAGTAPSGAGGIKAESKPKTAAPAKLPLIDLSNTGEKSPQEEKFIQLVHPLPL